MKRQWLSMDTAPKGETVEVRMKNGKKRIAHFAQDLSGEEQPPFKGWFTERSKQHPEYGYVQVDDPVAWRPMLAQRKRGEG